MYAERQAMNAPIQGTAADMIKLAMIEADALLKGRNSRMILQVHDELLIEWDPEEEEVVELIRTAMEKALELSVPVLVDAKAGENWLEMEPLPRPQS
jgi:DNA polymerase-1